MFKAFPFLLSAMPIEAFDDPIEAFDDMATLGALLRSTGGYSPRHRSPGSRAHRRWRKLRSSGRRG